MIKLIQGVLLFSFVLAGSAFATIGNGESTAHYIEGKVARIVDGDTIKFSPTDASSSKQKPLSIRLVGIDTPEQHFKDKNGNWANQGHWGDDASEYLSNILPQGSDITLLDKDTDKYGRVLGILYKNGTDMNLEMVRSGWAIPYFICSGAPCDESFFKDGTVESYQRACESAKNRGQGVFNPSEPLKEMPFEFRTRLSGRKYERYVADMKTKALYQPNDYKKVDVCNRVFFDRADVAERLGFYPEYTK